MLKYYSKLQVIHFQLWPAGGVVRLRKEGNHNQEKKKKGLKDAIIILDTLKCLKLFKKVTVT